MHILIAIFAVWEILVIWFHGSLFAGWRARIECQSTWPSRLLRCELCLAPWVSLPVILWLGASAFLYQPWQMLVQSPLYALAIARAANVLSDLTRGYSELHTEALLPVEDVQPEYSGPAVTSSEFEEQNPNLSVSGPNPD